MQEATEVTKVAKGKTYLCLVFPAEKDTAAHANGGKILINYCELYNQTSQTIRPFTGGMLLSSCMDHLSRLFLATLFSLGCGYCPIPIKMYHSPLFSDRVGIRVEELNVQAALSHNWCCSVRWMHKR